MRRFYIIFPIVLTVLFSFYYLQFDRRYKAEQDQKAQEALRIAAEEEAQKKALEAEAAAEGKRKAEEKARAEAERKAKLREEQQKIDSEIRQDTERALAELKRVNSELEATRSTLTTTRSNREKLEAATFDLAAQVERMKIARRTAEIELQRATEMMAERTDASALVQVPLFPAPLAPPTKK